jgi:hypothetical protein
MRFSVFLAAAMVLATTLPLHAQDEARLRKALEGKRITLKMDMPATSEGVDVFPGSGRPVDYDKVGKRMKKQGVAIKDGEAARITKVKVKGDLIEIQLNGGGYGTFGDGLGSLMKNQAADSGAAQQMKYQNQRTEKLAAGSRFNLRYPNGVDADALTPAAVIQALEEYATFPAGIAVVATQASYTSAASASTSTGEPASAKQVRKGMSSDDVAGLAGTPTSSKTNGPVTTNRYRGATGSLEVDFMNDIAVDVRQLPTAGKGALHKGMTIEEVAQLAGKPIGSARKDQMVTNRYNWEDGVLEADFYNEVLVAYRTSSR